MKILWINANPNKSAGGTETHSIHFIKELQKEKDIDLYIAIAKDSFVDKNLESFPQDKKVYVKIDGEFSPLSTYSLIKFAKKIKPDFIIGNNGNEYINTFITAKLSDAKPIVFRHMTNKQPFFLKKFILPKMFKVFAVSKYVKEGLIEQGLNKNVEIIPNFLEKNFIFDKQLRENFRNKLNLQNKKVFLFVGKFGKGIFDFLEIAKFFKKDKGKVFLIVGYGKEERKVKEIIKRELNENTLYIGLTKNPYKYYLVSDIFIMLSKADESFARTVIEAMATKTVVISYPSGNIPYLIEDGKNGLLTKNKISKEIIDKIITLDETIENRIKENAFKFFLENFSRDIVIEKFKSILSGGLK